MDMNKVYALMVSVTASLVFGFIVGKVEIPETANTLVLIISASFFVALFISVQMLIASVLCRSTTDEVANKAQLERAQKKLNSL